MKIYVDKLPKDCSECPLCMNGQVKLQKKGRYIDAKGCVLGDFYKYRTIDDDIDSCPLEIIKDKSNQKAIECLKEVKEYIYDGYRYCEMLREQKSLTKYGEGCLETDDNHIQFIDTKIKELEEV